MNLNDLLIHEGFDPQDVLVLRHRPDPELRKVFPWLAAERPELFNAYQSTHGEKLERAMQMVVGSGFIASFIGHEPGKALFVGLYSIDASKPLSYKKYCQLPAHIELMSLGMIGWQPASVGSKSKLLFDLRLTDFYAPWRGKLIVGWPPPERSWWRRAHRNLMPVVAVLEESALDTTIPEWTALELNWAALRLLPARWKSEMQHWRGIYYIFDVSDGKGYVGSAYGKDNLLGRWQNYAKHGHGDNTQLRKRDAANFRFTILQRVSPDMEATDVIRLESSWKERLHTRQPFGLNDN